MYRFRFEYIRGEESYDTLISEHLSIIEGLKKKDVDFVKKMMHTHLQNQIEAVRQIIKNYD